MRKLITPMSLLLLFTLLLTFNHPMSAQQNVAELALLNVADGAVLGNVTAVLNGNQLIVQFTPSASCMKSTYLYVGTTAPNTAAPQTYPYQHERSDCASTDSFVISGDWNNQFYIAAYANFANQVTTQRDLSVLTGTNANIRILAGDGSTSYLGVEIVSTNAGELLPLGQYISWCIDPYHSISPGSSYGSQVYVGSENLPSGLIGGSAAGTPQNMDLVNYVINHVEDYLALGATGYNIQEAIWALVDPVSAQAMIGYELYYHYALLILADAYAHGEGFSPSCGDMVGVMLDPSNNAQNQLVVIPVPCTTTTVELAAATGVTSFGEVPTPVPTTPAVATQEATAPASGTPEATPPASTTEEPTASVTEEPTASVTEEPTASVTEEPTSSATEEPTSSATEEPTSSATEEPTSSATEEPTASVTEEPTASVTEEPTVSVTEEPTASATEEPTASATEEPS